MSQNPNMTDKDYLISCAVMGGIMGVFFSVFRGNFVGNVLLGAFAGLMTEFLAMKMAKEMRMQNSPLKSLGIMFFVLLLIGSVLNNSSKSQAYKKGYAAGRDFGRELADQARMQGLPPSAYIDPDEMLQSMSASGVESEYSDDASQEQWESGYRAGMQSWLD